MSGLDPEGPSQPSQQTGLNQPQNPASKTSTEETTSQKPTDSTKIEQRVPSQHDQPAQPTAMASGDTGPLKERDISRSDAHPYSQQGDLEGEQMRAPGEGDVAHAVKSGGGGGHAEEQELVGDMDRKRQEHDDELKRRGQRTMEEIEEEDKEDWTGKRGDVDVGEALGGRGNKVVLAPEE